MNFHIITDFFNQILLYGVTQEVAMYVWFSAAIVFLLLELSTTGLLFFFPFTIGGFFAGLIAILDGSLILQCGVFLVISVISFWLMRHYFVSKRSSGVPTNTDALINQMGVVTQVIEPRAVGRVKVRGEEWLAESSEHVLLSQGTQIQVIAVRGSKLIVK